MFLLSIFLGIILFLIVILCFPVFVQISFRDSLKIKVKFLIFSFDILPQKTKTKSNNNAESVEQNNNTNYNFANNKLFSIIKEKGFFGFLKILKYVVDVLFYSAKKVLKKIHISSFDLYLLVANTDAASTAINYAKVCALVNYAKSVLFCNVNENKCYIEVIPGFNETECTVDFFTKIYFYPISMLGIACGAFCKFIKNMVSERV